MEKSQDIVNYLGIIKDKYVEKMGSIINLNLQMMNRKS